MVQAKQNSTTGKSPGLPFGLLALDFVGALLIVIAFLEGSAAPIGILPPQYREPPLLILLGLVGFLLMIPFIRWAIERAKASREKS